MQDRFKYRCWDKTRKEIRPLWSITPLRAVVGDIKTSEYGISFEDCEIMQCTGLKDNNGKLIYEGDIVKFSSIYGHGVFEIKWSDELATFGYEDEETDFSELGRLYQEAAYVEVISNIYENPELLEIKA